MRRLTDSYGFDVIVGFGVPEDVVNGVGLVAQEVDDLVNAERSGEFLGHRVPRVAARRHHSAHLRHSQPKEPQ